MPVNVASTVHKKKDPRSDFEKAVEKADGEVRLVFACPFGCGEPERPAQDQFGYCDHLIGFTNCTRENGSPTHAQDGSVRNPEGCVIELVGQVRNKFKRRIVSGESEPLRVGDYLVRVNGTSRRVYRKVEPTLVAKTTPAPAG